jgi:hypothetical protein
MSGSTPRSARLSFPLRLFVGAFAERDGDTSSERIRAGGKLSKNLWFGFRRTLQLHLSNSPAFRA